jgi:uncharacterized protein YndB with AHSA1/START domain
MEYASIEREIHIDAPPEVVFDVVSQPEHIKQWWGAETGIGPVAGSSSALVWPSGGEEDQHAAGVPIQIVVAEPPRVLTFRWTHPAAEQPVDGNSLLVTFELVPQRDGTLLRLTETGFRERGWEAAVLEASYRDHETSWDHIVPRIREYAESLIPR